MLVNERPTCPSLGRPALGLALISLGALLGPAAAAATAPSSRCGTQTPSPATLELVEQQSRDFGRGFVVPFAPTVVAVHMHVISSGPNPADGNVPDTQVQAQLARLNEAYAPRNFEFALASTTRTNNPAWATWPLPDPEPSAQELAAKNALHLGDRATLNLYVARVYPGALGWSTWPHDVAAQPLLDGVVVDFRSLPGGTLTGFNEGDTAVHEVGHWLGLLHTHHGFCSEPNDFIEDTPATTVIDRCPEGRDSCPTMPGLDPIHNYMSYSNDPCMTEFTNGQGTRMAVQHAQYRVPAPPACETACGQNQPCDKVCRRPDGTDTTCSGWGCCIGNCGGNPGCPGGSGGLAPYCADNCNPGRPCDKLCRLADETCSTCGQYGCCIGNCGGGGNCQGGSGGLAPYCSDACNPNKPCDKVCRLADETCSTCGLYGVCNQGLAPEEGAARLEDRPSCR